MITLSLNFDKSTKHANHRARAQEIRDIVDSHLAFPGSDNLKMGLNIKDNGSTSVSFAGPDEVVSEAKRLWQENVKPAVAKVNRTATQMKRTAAKVSLVATRATKTIKRKSPKKSAPKRRSVRLKAKVSRKTAKKRKS